jgi:hypothetical protein
MKRPVFALCAGLLLLGLLPGSALAAVTLDQSFTGTTQSLGGGATALAQTFKASVSGPVTEVDLWMNGDGAHPISVTLQATPATPSYIPTGTILATSGSGTPPTGSGGWVPFSFSSP